MQVYWTLNSLYKDLEYLVELYDRDRVLLSFNTFYPIQQVFGRYGIDGHDIIPFRDNRDQAFILNFKCVHIGYRDPAFKIIT